MAVVKHVTHELPPIVHPDSEYLILGSFPSVLSRAKCFYYGNPQNRFWKVLASIFGEEEPITNEQKENFCFLHHVALYDVIEECDIEGSSDSSIKNAIPSDVFGLITNSNIKNVILNGKKAAYYFERYQKKEVSKLGVDVYCLPSTSPANAAWSLSKLIDSWESVFLKK